MKRRLFIGGALFFILTATLIILLLIKDDVYFSNTNSRVITTTYFDIENKLTPDPSEPDTAILEVAISYKDKNDAKVKRGSINILASYDSAHSFRQFSSMASHYVFKVPTDKVDNSLLDLLINFKLDSSNNIIDKSISFKRLKKNDKYRWRPVLH